MSKLKLVKQISLRLMFADLVLAHGTVRFVAAYAPHSGYSRDVLDKFYEDLHACLEDARGKRFQLVVGGDFNTQLNTGFRGTLLQDVVETFDLIITNDDDNHICNMETWTFESSCGLRRRIDFIMCSQEMRFTSVHATCNLDLGSDHRAVTVSLDLGFRRRRDRKCFRCVKRWKPPLGPQGVPHAYHAILQEELGVKKPTTLYGLEDVLQQSVRRINTTSKLPKPKPVWQDAVLQDLLQRRRAAHDRSERANLSKLIRKHLRRNMRRRRNARVSQILAEFPFGFGSKCANSSSGNGQPCRGFLGNIFMSDTGHDTATLAGLDDADCLDLVPPFTLQQERGTVLRDLHYGRAADADDMVAEMVKYSNIPLQKCLLNIYNSMLASGSFETSWQHTLFTMLPKPGGSSQPNNWRPIAVVKITYKIFSRLLYNRLRVVMDDQQPYDQTGFRTIDDAFVVLECLSSKSLEWNAPIWFANLDLTKAFDRIEYSPLFDALLQQSVPRSYCTLLWKLYKGLTGSVHGSERFFFFLLFDRRLSSSNDCFTGQSPGIGHDGSHLYTGGQ